MNSKIVIYMADVVFCYDFEQNDFVKIMTS